MNMIWNGWSRPWHLTLYLKLLLNSCARCRPAFTDGQRTAAEITCSKTSFYFNGTASHVKKLGIPSFPSRENEIPPREPRPAKTHRWVSQFKYQPNVHQNTSVFLMLKCRNLVFFVFILLSLQTVHFLPFACLMVHVLCQCIQSRQE